MSSRNWGHGQTFVGGAIAGLALSYRPWLIFAGGVLVGAAVVLLAKFAGRIGLFVVELIRGRRANYRFHRRIVRGRRVRTVNGRARVVRGRGF